MAIRPYEYGVVVVGAPFMAPARRRIVGRYREGAMNRAPTVAN